MYGNDFSENASRSLACIFSVSGYELSEAEASLFRSSNPFGFILFERNCKNPEQVKKLTDSLKEVVGRDCPILIDQEGGRVQRLKPPHWRNYPPFRDFGDTYQDDPEKALSDLRFETLRLVEELVDVGVNVNCTPVLDLFFEGAHDIIGDRAFSDDVDVVSCLGTSVCRHHLSAGVTPIIKHIPGHGRALVDSHHDLPVVDIAYETLVQTDFVPFRELARSDVGRSVWAMTAHIVYSDIDAELPMSLSSDSIQRVIRNEIGFDGVVICDDLDMKALDPYGDVLQRATTALDAGCDLALYCHGDLQKMDLLASGLPTLSDEALRRLKQASQESVA